MYCAGPHALAAFAGTLTVNSSFRLLYFALAAVGSMSTGNGPAFTAYLGAGADVQSRRWASEMSRTMVDMSFTPGKEHLNSTARYRPSSSFWYCSRKFGIVTCSSGLGSGLLTTSTSGLVLPVAGATACGSLVPQIALWSSSAALTAGSIAPNFPPGAPGAARASMPFTHSSMCSLSPERARWRSSGVRPPSLMNFSKSSGDLRCSSCSCCFAKASNCALVASWPRSISVLRSSIFEVKPWGSAICASSSNVMLSRSSARSVASWPSGWASSLLFNAGTCDETWAMKVRLTSGPPRSTARRANSLARLCAATSPL
mmetsp:Transcript_65299/g.142237  ORF Transcript_65299/g.142237 Transcript_65299/m.142237 type:complete len:315 (-) Transcript_65299:308-1252(-)